MPIKGLTDRGLSFPEIGQIRKGAKKTGNRPGEDLTYFRVEFDEREQKADAAFREIYKDKPQHIKIVLPFNEIERMWDAWLEAYTAGRMVARSDGEIFTYLIDTETGEILVKNGIDIKTGLPRPYQEDQPVGYYGSNGDHKPIFCKPSGRLKVIIPELARAAYLTVLTTSIHDIANISDQLRAFQELNGGVLAGIPLILRRRPKKISTPNQDGTRARRVKWLLSIEADPEWVKRRIAATKEAALPGNGFVAALPAPEQDEYLETDYDDDEIEEGDYQEQETKDNSARPYVPTILRARLKEFAGRHVKHTANKDQRGLVSGMLNIIFLGDDDNRHTLQSYLFGKPSLNDATDDQVLAALDWLKPTRDDGGAYQPDPMAEREAHAVISEALKAEGQAELGF